MIERKLNRVRPFYEKGNIPTHFQVETVVTGNLFERIAEHFNDTLREVRQQLVRHEGNEAVAAIIFPIGRDSIELLFGMNLSWTPPAYKLAIDHLLNEKTDREDAMEPMAAAEHHYNAMLAAIWQFGLYCQNCACKNMCFVGKSGDGTPALRCLNCGTYTMAVDRDDYNAGRYDVEKYRREFGIDMGSPGGDRTTFTIVDPHGVLTDEDKEGLEKALTEQGLENLFFKELFGKASPFAGEEMTEHEQLEDWHFSMKSALDSALIWLEKLTEKPALPRKEQVNFSKATEACIKQALNYLGQIDTSPAPDSLVGVRDTFRNLIKQGFQDIGFGVNGDDNTRRAVMTKFGNILRRMRAELDGLDEKEKATESPKEEKSRHLFLDSEDRPCSRKSEAKNIHITSTPKEESDFSKTVNAQITKDGKPDKSPSRSYGVPFQTAIECENCGTGTRLRRISVEEFMWMGASVTEWFCGVCKMHYLFDRKQSILEQRADAHFAGSEGQIVDRRPLYSTRHYVTEENKKLRDQLSGEFDRSIEAIWKKINNLDARFGVQDEAQVEFETCGDLYRLRRTSMGKAQYEYLTCVMESTKGIFRFEWRSDDTGAANFKCKEDAMNALLMSVRNGSKPMKDI